MNSYADQLSKGLRPESAQVEFYVREASGQGLTRVVAELPAWGSLGPLFLAFGLITAQELAQGTGAVRRDAPDDRNLAAWLHQVVEDAVRAADAHDALKRLIRQLRTGLEARFGLTAVAVGGEFAVGSAEQQRQVDALRTLEACLNTLCADDPQCFEGLSVRCGLPLPGCDIPAGCPCRWTACHVPWSVVGVQAGEAGCSRCGEGAVPAGCTTPTAAHWIQCRLWRAMALSTCALHH